MPTYRKLHTKIIDSYDFAEMPDDFTRVFWMLLIVTVDSEGRAIDNPTWLRSRMYPMRGDVEAQQIDAALDWLAGREMIVRYQAAGRWFFFIPNFKKYQSGTEREAKSVLPAPPVELVSKSEQSQEEVESSATAIASATATESVSECVNDLRPNIFTIYEHEIGALTPMIGEQLGFAEKDYPPGWVEDALKESALCNKRSWKYAEAILKRWKVEGRASKKNGNGVHPRKVIDTLYNIDGSTIKKYDDGTEERCPK